MGGYQCVTNKNRHNESYKAAGHRVHGIHRWSETPGRGALSAWVYLGLRNDSEVLAKMVRTTLLPCPDLLFWAIQEGSREWSENSV